MGDPTLLEFGGLNQSDAPAPRGECPECQSLFSGDARFCPFDGQPLVRRLKAQPKDALVGAIVDQRYQVLDVLGEGGMGTVYRVQHVALAREFALKVLKRTLARDTELALRFLHEARAAAKVRHPAVVEITDFGQLDSGQSYFVMELLAGELLSRVIQRSGPLPAGRAARIVEQVAEALGAAHDAGVIHRDLKPDNVWIGSSERESDLVKVLDFGLAKVAGSSRLTRQGMVFGTPHYMSPEQATGESIDHRTDVYSLGVLIYQMLTGRVPFEADSFVGVLTQHMMVRPTPPSALVEAGPELVALEGIALRCLEKRPDNRYGSMAELLAELRGMTPSSGKARPMLAAADFGPTGGPGVRFRARPSIDGLVETGSSRFQSTLRDRRVVWIVGAAAAGLAIAVSAVYRRGRPDLASARPVSATLTTSERPAPAASTALRTATAVLAEAPAEPSTAPLPAEPSTKLKANVSRPNKPARESGTLRRKVQSVGEIVNPWER